MFGLFGTNTPQYEGTPGSASQPRSGVLGFLSRLLGGGGTPVYGGSLQPYSSGSSGGLFPSSPQYARPAPDAASSPDAPGSDDEVGKEDPQQAPPPAKTVTIIVKPGPGTTVEEVADYFRSRTSPPRA